MKKLISMVEFVLKQRQKENTDNILRFWACERYANFLKQPLELWMFVPVGENGDVLEEHKENEYLSSMKPHDRNEYQHAESKVLFDGLIFFEERPCYYLFDSKNGIIWVDKNKTIEDIIHLNLELTPTAQKQISC